MVYVRALKNVLFLPPPPQKAKQQQQQKKIKFPRNHKNAKQCRVIY